jgi:preprotein translocase subunit YajC
MWITPAYAQGASAAGGFDIMAMAPLVLIFVVFYFLLIRPQQKRARQQKEMLTALKRGDRVVTGGGIIGTVSKVVNDQELQVEIAEGVRVRVMRSTVSDILAKTEPRAAAEPADTTPDKPSERPKVKVGSGPDKPA